MSSSWKTLISGLAALVVVALVASSALDRDPTDVLHVREPANETPAGPPPPPVEHGVLYDDVWEITEGVWALTDQDFPRLSHPARASNGLLEEGGPRALWVFAPGMYGGFPTRLTNHASEPSAPPWCEDIVEAPLRVNRGMVGFLGFEDLGGPFPVGSGDFRVRLCVKGLDDPLADPEVRGSDGTSTSRFEFQVWPAAWAAGEIVQVGSDFAREAHAAVAAAHRAATS